MNAFRNESRGGEFGEEPLEKQGLSGKYASLDFSMLRAPKQRERHPDQGPGSARYEQIRKTLLPMSGEAAAPEKQGFALRFGSGLDCGQSGTVGEPAADAIAPRFRGALNYLHRLDGI